MQCQYYLEESETISIYNDLNNKIINYKDLKLNIMI